MVGRQVMSSGTRDPGSGRRSAHGLAPRLCALCIGLVFEPGVSRAEAAPPLETAVLPDVRCVAEQTGGFHDYPDDAERYEPALFYPHAFRLETNQVFMMNLAGDDRNADLYLTMTRELPDADGVPASETTELECRRVRGANEAFGFSCVNLPPSEMILINAQSLRFTRTAVGGWTFAAATATHEGDSIFVEYGQCEAPVAP